MRPGDIVGERYEIVKKLGAGGMGTLWRARHLELEIDVALKVVSPAEEDPNSLARFEREAKAVARLKSPHIVSVMDYGVFDGRPVLVMELLRGEDLATFIGREGPVELERCRQIVDQMCKAVQVAHDAGIIHRDLKPANVFLEKVGDDEIVKVLDFGVAKDLKREGSGHKTSTGALVGSPAYMSPEQVWNRKVGFASDVWALGVITLEMLTCTQPFEDDSMAKIFEHIVRDPLPRPSALNGRLPAAIDELFEQVFERDEARRIQSPRQFRALFDEALGARPTSAPASTKERPGQSADTPARPSTPATVLMDKDQVQSKPSTRAWVVGIVVGVLALVGAVLVTRSPPEPEGAPMKPSPAAPQADQGLPKEMRLETATAPSRAPAPKPEDPSVYARPTKQIDGEQAPKPRSPKPRSPAGDPPHREPPASVAPSSKPALSIDPKFGVPVTE